MMELKISEIRLLNITVIKDGSEIYKGKTEECPEEIKKLPYKDIHFNGVDLILEI